MRWKPLKINLQILTLLTIEAANFSTGESVANKNFDNYVIDYMQFSALHKNVNTHRNYWSMVWAGVESEKAADVAVVHSRKVVDVRRGILHSCLTCELCRTRHD